MEIELRDLRMVRMIVEAGNLTKAAVRLHISQPALSRQLIDLESRLGASLFERQPRRMLVTDIGREVLRVAEEVLDKIDHAERSIARRLEGHGGELKFGVHCIFCFAWLPEIIRTFQQRFPEVHITINSTEDYLKDLGRGRCDMVITPFTVNESGISYDELFCDDIVAIVSPEHALASKECICLEDFSQTAYLSFLGQARDPFYAILRASGVEPQTYMTFNQANALMLMVRAGLGVALAPRFSVKDMVDSNELKQYTIAGLPMQWKWLIARKDNQPLEVYSGAFIQMIRDFMA